MLHNHQVPLSLLALSAVAALMVAAPKSSVAEPKVLPLAHGQTAGTMEVGYRYRRYRYAERPYYRYGCYRPFWHSIW
jgi:hypothetical protein